MRETLLEGEDFESGWISKLMAVPFEHPNQDLVVIVVEMHRDKDATKYMYIVESDVWENVKGTARNTLHDEEASLGRSYNDEIKKSAHSEATGTGKVTDKQIEEAFDYAQNGVN